MDHRTDITVLTVGLPLEVREPLASREGVTVEALSVADVAAVDEGSVDPDEDAGQATVDRAVVAQAIAETQPDRVVVDGRAVESGPVLAAVTDSCPDVSVSVLVDDPVAGNAAIAAGATNFVVAGEGAAEALRTWVCETSRTEVADVRLLYERIRSMLRATDERDLAERTVAAAEEVVGLPVTVVLLADASGSELRPVAATDAFDRLVDYDPTFYPDGSIVWRAFEEGTVERHADVRTDEQVANPLTEVRTQIAVPIGEHGVLVCASTERTTFGERTIDLAQVLATGAEVALDRLGANERLQAERDRFARLFETLLDPAVEVEFHDGVPVIQSVNEAFERTFGHVEADVVGESINDVIVPPSEMDVATDISARVRAGEPVREEVTRETAEGLGHFQFQAVPLADRDPLVVYGIYRDVTDRYRRERRLEVLNRVLRHDLRNHANVVTAAAEAIVESADAENAGRAETIRDATFELARISEQVREVESLVRQGQTDRAETDLAAVTSAAVDAVAAEHPTVSIRVDTGDAGAVHAVSAMEVAIFNVVEKAAAHVDAVAVRLSREHRDGRDWGVVEVHIPEPGLPQDDIDIVRSGRETDLEHLSGLGLWLTDWVVEESGGELTFETAEDGGTVVRLSFPAV